MQTIINFLDAWSEIPPTRRHTYFYVCLVLCPLAFGSLQSEDCGRIEMDLDNETVAKVMEMQSCAQTGNVAMISGSIAK